MSQPDRGAGQSAPDGSQSVTVNNLAIILSLSVAGWGVIIFGALWVAQMAQML